MELFHVKFHELYFFFINGGGGLQNKTHYYSWAYISSVILFWIFLIYPFTEFTATNVCCFLGYLV